MISPISKCVVTLILLVVAASALDGIVVPDTVSADTPFDISFQSSNSDQYRVFLAASLVGANGPACYLLNSTTLTSTSLSLSIPSTVGPSADYYTIAIADLTTSQGATYSNRFNLTGANGTYSAYEDHLGGAAFWDADHLPCTAYGCARDCAQTSYPGDLTDPTAYAAMRSCILACPGVTPDAHASAAPPGLVSAIGAEQALVTLAPGEVVSAVETWMAVGSSSSVEVAVVDGGQETLTLGGAAATISGHAVSLATGGVRVGDSTTVAFETVTETATTFLAGARTTSAGVAATSKAAAVRIVQSHGKRMLGGLAIAGAVAVLG